MNRKARRKALAMVLTDKVLSGSFIAVDSLELGAAKTKTFAGILKAMPLKSKKTIVILEPKNTSAARAARNMPRVSTISASSVNIVDLLAHDGVIASREAIDVLTKTFARA